MATFPNDRQSSRQQSAVVFIDSKCRTLAPITDYVTGATIPGSVIQIGIDGLWPLFNSSAAVLYYRNPANQIVMFLPNVAAGATVTLTGSRGTQTAAVLAQLITAVANSGLPIVDNTTA